jgi:hypothetical protein
MHGDSLLISESIQSLCTVHAHEFLYISIIALCMKHL